MLGDQGVGGLDFREVRHCGVGLQQFKIELGKKMWNVRFLKGPDWVWLLNRPITKIDGTIAFACGHQQQAQTSSLP